MKTFLLILLGAVIALVFVNRQRIYLCDPLAKVYKYAPLQGKLAATPMPNSSRPILPKSHTAVENNAETTVTDNRYGVVTEQSQGGGAQSGAANSITNLQSSVANVQQSGHTILNLGDKSDPALPVVLMDDPSKGRQSGVQVFVNLNGNVLLERDSDSSSDVILLQSWNKSAGVPKNLSCLHWLACLSDADHATVDALDWIGNSGRGRGKYDPHLSTSEHSVWFVDGTGSTIRVDLH